jgi:hypothetical protein
MHSKGWMSALTLALTLVASMAWSAETRCNECRVKAIDADKASELLLQTKAQPIALRVRRQGRAAASEPAYERVEAAISAVLRAHGKTVTTPSDQARRVDVEVDTWFYVLTSKFNARRIWLSEFAQIQIDGSAGASPQAPTPTPDALRIAAGVVGLAKGWISPGFGSYMVASGARNAFFGSGSAPNRSLLPDAGRYERGEQEVASRVRLSIDGQSVSFVVLASAPGDAEPYQVEALAAANWTAIGKMLSGVAVEAATGSVAVMERR